MHSKFRHGLWALADPKISITSASAMLVGVPLAALNVMLCYGPLICMAAYVIQADRFSPEILWLSLPLGIFIAAFLWVNQFPDHDADRSHGKHNLLVKLGKQRASRVLPALYLTGYTVLLPATVWLGFASVPTAAFACHWSWLDPQTFYRHKLVQPMALLSFVIYAAGLAVGVLAAA